MAMIEDRLLSLCKRIEAGLVREYERTPGLTDPLCIFGLDNARIAIRQRFGHARNEHVSPVAETQGVIEACVSIAVETIDEANGISLKDYLSLLEKIKRSVERHSEHGTRGYYEFVRRYVS